MSFKTCPVLPFPVTTTDSSAELSPEPGSFAHLVKRGWSSERANGDMLDLQVEPDFHGDDLHLDSCSANPGFFDQSLSGISERGYFGPHSAEPSEPCNLDGDAYGSDGSWMPAVDFEDAFSEVPFSCDVSACVEAAYAMLPPDPPKPIWEQGVFADIFGDGVFLKSSWTSLEPKRRPLVSMPVTAVADETRASKKARVSDRLDPSVTYADIVAHKTDQTWQEEREAILQNALKRWLVVSTYFNAKTVIRVQLDCELTELGKLTLLADVFRGRAPATLLKRVRAVEKVCSWLGVGNFPPTEPLAYKFFSEERMHGAPPSRLKGYMEAFSFCRHVLSVDELTPVVQSKRCAGTTTADVPSVISQASPLKVEELKLLHWKLHHGEPWDKVFSGAVLFAVYARSRWADLMHCDEVFLDRDNNQTIQYIEGRTSIHKTMRAAVFRHQFLPLTAPAFGVNEDCWPQAWLEARHDIGVMLPPFHTVMPCPDSDGFPSKRPLSATEASQWLRKVLTGNKSVDESRKISVHSCKSTCLSYCAKYGIDAMVRMQLGYHSGGSGGLRMVHTYSRDAASEPLSKLEQVLGDIRDGRFMPDCTRSGRFLPNLSGKDTAESKDAWTMLGSAAGGSATVDLVSDKSESESDEEVASSSSDGSSEEEFQEEQKRLKSFLPPVPPEGYVFWQHGKSKILHLAPPDHRRAFMCNRLVGTFHSKENLSIRYDTPVCRFCVNATKPSG